MFKKFTVAAAALLLCAGLAHAADDCDKQAADKKLAGAAKTNFVKKCTADAATAAPVAATASPAAAGCEKAAGEKKLAGAAKSSYMKKCTADGGPAAAAAAAPASATATATATAPAANAACDKQAADKKLAGAAKTSFVKKCSAEAK